MHQTKVPHLYNRKGMFYFRYRFSTSVRFTLNQWEYCRSLDTTDFDKASMICIRLRINAKELERMVGEMDNKQLTKDKADELIQWYFKEKYEESETLLGMDMERPDRDLSLELIDVEEVKSKLTREIMSKRFSLLTVSDAEELLEINALNLPEKGPVRLQLLEGIARARYELYRIYIETIKGNFHERVVKDDLFAGVNPNQRVELITPINNVNEDNKHKVSNLIEKYVSIKSQKVWTKKTIEENTRCLNWLKECVDKVEYDVDFDHLKLMK